jgi:hypothetical protein
MKNKRIQSDGGPTGGSGAKQIGLLGWALTALTCCLSLGVAGASGCGDTIDSRGQSETAEPREALGEARQADSTPVSCVTLQGGLTKAFDSMVSSEKSNNNYGASTVALAGQASGSGADHFYALFKFDTALIPVNATLTSATVALSQVAPAPGSWNAHLITAPWDEATVTWNSFGSAFNPAIFKSASTATASVVFNIAPQLQAWVSGSAPNHGFLIELPGVSQTKIKTREFVLPNGRPSIAACYKVGCAPHFADCNGVAADGCEADLHSPATCGSCGSPCALPHATPSCAAGTCAVGSCDLGWSDCDGNPANGCETDLTTASNCGACGVPCALPHAATSCASGSCKVLSCNVGSFDCDGNAANGCEATPCDHGSHCAASAGCLSQVCVGGFCASPACNDHAKNGSESDVDCGGSCPPCSDGAVCGASGDCQSAVCSGESCAAASCQDGVKNGSESDVDCGGACAPCADARLCAAGSDCASGVCISNLCHAPACSDGVKNGSETGVDCGGSCGPCANGTGCLVAGDCQSGVCTGAVCQIPSCADGVKNGSESDVDCGGSCADCSDNQACTQNADCSNGVCTGGSCHPATCTDGVKNGNETGVDCGGACTVAEVCNGVDDDCNGSTDEGLGTTSCGVGACQVTVQNCVGGVVQSCLPGAPKAEICDGQLDDDCDGVVDNGCDCVNGATQGCYTGSLATQNVGSCHGGTQTCALGHWGACVGQVLPAAESCNGKDDDCNGSTDEGLGSTICGVGACQVMVQNCVAGAVQSCVPGAPSAEICDGKDNDCNGQVDEGLPTVSCGVGACTVTVPSCVSGAANVCNPHASDGVSCNDGHDCTGSDACQAGVCAGNNLPSSTVCRAAVAGGCDVAETCTGASPDCPADAKAAAGTVCRAAAGVCDVAETCTGASTSCPADGKVASGTVCRAAVAGGCDVAESCDGASNACPADAVVAIGTVCRASAGACDPVEACNGSNTCPGNTLSSAGTVCRGSAGVCDVVESCTGAAAACPADAFASSATVCRAAVVGGCDVSESCTGSGVSCPADGGSSALCANGGSCASPAGSFVCSCAAGFTGATCQTNINDCSPNPCQNGGTCTDGVNSYTCACPAGYSGTNCQVIPTTACLAGVSGVVSYDPDGVGGPKAAFNVYCDANLAGGGWTLISNRRGGTTNIEACGSNLAQFFTSGCGSAAQVGYASSYALSAAQRAELHYTKVLIIQYDAQGVADTDDAYIMDTSAELFPNTNVLTDTPVSQVCNINGASCDVTSVFFRYIGDYWYHSSMCLSSSSFDATYRGNYGLCNNGVAYNGSAGSYPSSSGYGNRSEYQETKLWAHPNVAAAYQERIFVR